MTEDKSREEFEAWWQQEREQNGGVEIGADYRHWALLSWKASRRTCRASDVSKNAPNLDTLAERVHEARISALEEAAKVCDETWVTPGDLQSENCHAAAAAIRALAQTQEGQEPCC